MRLTILLAAVLISSISFGQKKFSFQVTGLPVRQGIIYKPVTKLDGNIVAPVNGAQIETGQDSCFSLTDGEVTAVFDLGDEYACVVRYANNMRMTYAGLKDVDGEISRGQLIRKGTFIGLLNKQEKVGSLTFMLTNQKGANLAFDKIIAFIKKNMKGSYQYRATPVLTAAVR
ncbi:hypothetical protein [Foetidibacter luteolus]|uniref:hypothetical protein n=1 Tax=Foetidibacter luteolus TaxID=2608880 RepID=UPI00129BED7F|nr:hypothetical protein [Foetidibacter luteolus]